MTPTEYIAHIDTLVRSGDYEALAALVRQHQPAMLPLLNYEQIIAVATAMEVVHQIMPDSGRQSRVDVDANVGRT